MRFGIRFSGGAVLAATGAFLMGCFNDAPTNFSPDPDPVDTTHFVEVPVDTTPVMDTVPPRDTIPPLPDSLPSGWEQTASEAAGGRTLRASTRGDSLFVAGGDSGAILISRDGATWTPVESGTDRTVYQVVGGTSGRPFVLLAGGEIRYSPDGIHWSRAEIPVPSTFGVTLSQLAWNGTYFLLAGSEFVDSSNPMQGVLYRSPDGVNWTQIQGAPKWQALSGDPTTGLFTARILGQGTYTSPDGMAWTRVP